MIQRFRKVAPGLYRGSAPDPQDVMKLKEQLGIRKIVSLDKETGEKIDRACKLLGIKHIKLYLDGSRKTLLHFLSQDLKKVFLEGGPTFMHCHEGKDRTGFVSALVKCKYLGMDPEKAIEEAKSLGFGIGVDPSIIHLYEKIIRSCKKVKDTNNADIVSTEREYQGDNRDGFLDEVNQGSFAPYLDHTRQNPMDALYPYTLDQSPTRENYPDTSLFQYDPSKGDAVPNVGEFDNDAGQRGFGPSENYNGFFSDVGK
jgi:protein tyrosine/serine phosphatase